jgi:hypothetical protein
LAQAGEEIVMPVASRLAAPASKQEALDDCVMMSFLLSEDKFRLEYLNACLYSTCLPFIPDEKTKHTRKS